LKENSQNWGNNGWQIYVQMADHADVSVASAKIKDAIFNKATNGDQRLRMVLIQDERLSCTFIRQYD